MATSGAGVEEWAKKIQDLIMLSTGGVEQLGYEEKLWDILCATCFDSPDSVKALLCALKEARHEDVELRKNIILVMKGICNYDCIKKYVTETSDTVEMLVDATRSGSGSRELRIAAAGLLGKLATINSANRLIGKCGAVGHLMDLCQSPNELEAAGVANVIHSLCYISSNTDRAVEGGLIKGIMETIDYYLYPDIDSSVVDLMFDVLRMSFYKCRAEHERDAINWLFTTIIFTATTQHIQRHCMSILHLILLADNGTDEGREMIRTEERLYGCLENLCNAEFVSRVMATEILDLLR